MEGQKDERLKKIEEEVEEKKERDAEMRFRFQEL